MRGTPPSAIVHAVLEFIWGMSVGSRGVSMKKIGLNGARGLKGVNGIKGMMAVIGMNGVGLLAERKKKNKYRPSDKEPFMNERQRNYFRERLSAWREDILKEAKETLQHL